MLGDTDTLFSHDISSRRLGGSVPVLAVVAGHHVASVYCRSAQLDLCVLRSAISKRCAGAVLSKRPRG